MTPVQASRSRLALGLAALGLAAIALLWPATAPAQSPSYSRAIPSFPGPLGSADPAARVRRLGGIIEAPALRARPGPAAAADDHLYRRMADGAYLPVTAPGYVVVNAGCPATGAIGCNVAHAVTLSIIAIDADGRVLSNLDVIGARGWFTALKFRSVPDPARDLDCTPAILGLPGSYQRYAAAIGASVPEQTPTDADRREAGCPP